MSRVGKAEISVPENIKVEISNKVLVSDGKQTMEVSIPDNIKINMSENIITVTRGVEDNKTKSLHGLTRNLIANAVNGFRKPFEKVLNIKGIGYKANVSGRKFILNVGYSHPVEIEIPEYLNIKVDGKGTEVVVSGVDKSMVGEMAAEIRAIRPPEPYKATGIMYQGERIIRKAGKAAGK